MIKKSFVGFSLAVFLLFGAVFFVSAQTTTGTSSTAQLIETLKQQIESLQAKIAALKNQQQAVKEEKKEVKATLFQLKQNLKEGMTGEDVTLLQEFLASDKDIYPEGQITGYFGRLTAKAVRSFQKRHGIDQAGIVGPQTRDMINKIFERGEAGKSGKIPQGILKNFSGDVSTSTKKIVICHIPSGNEKAKHTIEISVSALNAHMRHGDKLGACGSTEPAPADTTAPAISGINATTTTVSSASIVWNTDEAGDSKVWYGTVTPLDVNSTTTASVLSNTSLVLNHSLSLAGLTASTTYYFVVSSADGSNNRSISSEQSFTTLIQ